MKTLFLKEAEANKAFPIGAGNGLRLHPEDRVATPYTSWQFDATTTRMPEFTAPRKLSSGMRQSTSEICEQPS